MSRKIKVSTDAACGYLFDATHFSSDFSFSMVMAIATPPKNEKSQKRRKPVDWSFQGNEEAIGGAIGQF